MKSPFKMKGFSGHGNSPMRQLLESEKTTAHIKELEQMKSNILSPADFTASTDTISQANVEYFKEQRDLSSEKTSINMYNAHIKDHKSKQTNPNITTTGSELDKAATRSQTRISKHKRTEEYGGEEGINENIEYNKMRRVVQEMDEEKIERSKINTATTKKSTPKKKKIGWLGLPDMGVTEFFGF